MPKVRVVNINADDINGTIRELIRGAGSKFGAVVFVKKRGELRKLTFQHAKDNSARVVGSELGARMSATFAANNPNMLRCWDHAKQAWRTVTLDRVCSVRVSGVSIRFRDPATLRAA